VIQDKKGIFWRLLHTSERVKIGLYFLLFFVQIVAYTALFHYAYPILENKPISWPTAVLFVLETVTTTGYGELLPFTNQITIVIAIIMMVTGIILIFMIIPLLLIPYLSSMLHTTAPRRTPHELERHVVIVGHGELTKSLIESLMISDLSLLMVVDDDQTAKSFAQRFGKRAYVIWGDYANPVTWQHAWIKNASHVIVCEDERTTAMIILGIREMTTAHVIAVVDKLSFDRYLKYAGAEYVLSPKHITGQILARHAGLSSHTSKVLEETVYETTHAGAVSDPDRKIRFLHIPIISCSPAAGKTLKELSLFSRYGVDVLFLSRLGHFQYNPSGEEVLDTSTMLFLVGNMTMIKEMMEREFLKEECDTTLAIIAGYGDVGSAAYSEFTSLGIDCIVIDKKPHPVSEVVGNAEDEMILRQAHVEDARICVVALNDDDLNIFTTLMARNLNPSLRILARANEAVSVDKLYRAGADYVALLPTIGGQVIAGVVLSDIVHIILDLPNGQKVVRKRTINTTPKNVDWIERKSGVRVIGIEGYTRSLVRPPPDTELMEGDSLLVTGDAVQLKKFIRLV
jgi:K+ transport systems, NAD-binding component